jgi:hypothetical protein
MRGVERLDQDDVVAAAGQRQRRGEAGDAAADDPGLQA